MTYLHSPRPPLPEGAAPSEVNIPARREDSTAPKNLAQSYFFKKSKCAMLPEFLALKHESRFSDRVLGPCMWFLHVGTGWTLCCLAHGELPLLFLERDTGLNHCPRILLSCFRARISVPPSAMKMNTHLAMSRIRANVKWPVAIHPSIDFSSEF